MSDEIFVEKLTVKEGAKDGRPWKRTAAKDAISNEWFSTFDETLAGKLVEGKRFRVEYESKPLNGRVLRDLKTVEPVEENGSVPESYSHQKPDGEADWDKVAIGKTRCALWKSFLEGHLAANLYAKAVAAKDDKDPMDYVIITGTRLVVHAERDTFERQPGDDGIPFE